MNDLQLATKTHRLKGKTQFALSLALASLGLMAIQVPIARAENKTATVNETAVANMESADNTASASLSEAATAVDEITATTAPEAQGDVAQPADTTSLASETTQMSPTVYQADDYLTNGTAQSQTITVEGIVTGALSSATQYGQVKTNVALAHQISTQASATVPVQLPKGTWRDQYNIVDHPDLIGKTVRITAQAERYFSRNGLKNIQTIELVAAGNPPQPNLQPSPQPNPAPTTQPNPTIQTLAIGAIQGASHQSPYTGQQVHVNDAIVTYIDGEHRFYIQDLRPDQDVRTSDGIMVYQRNHTVTVGDILSLIGTVEEYVGQGYNDRAKTDLTITQLKAQTVTKTGTGTLPAPIVLGKDRIAPTKVVDNDGMQIFDPEEDGLDFWESLEGMLVAVDNPRVLGPQLHREIYIVPSNYTGYHNQVGGLLLGKDDYHPEKIAVLFDQPLTAKSGDSFNGRIVGPISYSYTNYKLLSHLATAPTLVDGHVVPEFTTITQDENKLTLASYNIENFSANPQSTSAAKVARIAQSIISDLHSPDIITLLEVQDNDGQTNSGNTDASLSAQRLIDAIVAAGGIAYRYADIAPENNQDGGAPGANIRTGFLYNPNRVSLADTPRGNYQTAAEWVNGQPKYSLARINPIDSNWEHVRKPLVGHFKFKDQDITIIAVHLNSKLGDNGVFGRVQPVQFASEAKRHELASQINHFVALGKQQNPAANIAILGDFNDYEFSRTLELVEKDFLFNLVRSHNQADRFSYFYQGNNQSLDHIVLSNNLAGRYVFDMVHVNSPFMAVHGRASDHDPLLVQIDLRPITPTDHPDTPNPAAPPTIIEVNPNRATATVTYPPIQNADVNMDKALLAKASLTPHLPETGETPATNWLWLAIASLSTAVTSLLTWRKRQQ